ncbi:MAG: DUF192 domain-containing protein [Parachlamydiales bacterium]|nr:DUF192 domain-containing protein [Parachlamydiales bacterium]
MRILIFLGLFSSIFALEKTIRLGKETLNVEIADTFEARRQGLMGRQELPEGKGMLFIYDRAYRLAFWMKDTLIPLSIGFFDDDKRLIEVLDMDPPIGETLIKYRCTAPALYALEVPQGWFEKHKIHIGDKFSFLEPVDQVK